MPAKSSMTLTELRTLARSVGLATAGTKPTLQHSLSQHLKNRGNRRAPTAPPRTGSLRVLSLDMGIRNLAYCLIECDASDMRSRSGDAPPGNGAIFAHLRANVQHTIRSARVSEWARIDVLNRLKTLQESVPAARPQPDDHEDEVSLSTDPVQSSSAGGFDIHALAEAASSLVRDVLLPMRPTHIVIERQRHRSGGSPNVLEWTFRVNMLEGMLWSSIQTLQDLHRDRPPNPALPLENTIRCLEKASIDPKRMSNLWLSEGADTVANLLSAPAPESDEHGVTHNISATESSVVKLSPREVKAARIRLVQGLLIDDHLTTLGDAHETRTHLLGAGAKRKSMKKDDLADCLLQGLVFLAWEENTSYLADALPKNALS